MGGFICTEEVWSARAKQKSLSSGVEII